MYYFFLDGANKSHGPFGIAELKEKLSSGELNSVSLVAKAGEDVWVPLSQIFAPTPSVISGAETLNSSPGGIPAKGTSMAAKIGKFFGWAFFLLMVISVIAKCNSATKTSDAKASVQNSVNNRQAEQPISPSRPTTSNNSYNPMQQHANAICQNLQGTLDRAREQGMEGSIPSSFYAQMREQGCI